MATLLTGLPAANALTESLLPRVVSLKAGGIFPTLAILRIGARPDDIAYEKGAINRCAKCGIDVRCITLPENTAEETLSTAIESINVDKTIHGVLMLKPFPNHIDTEKMIFLLDPAKDLDGMTIPSLAKLYSGKGIGFPPCTAEACMEILKFYNISVEGKKAIVVGRSLVIGKPVAMMLLEKNATVTLCHSGTANLEQECQQADILVAALGRPKFIGAKFLTSNQVVLDVGINDDGEGGLCGDVDFSVAEPIVKAITPVPRGIGSMTTALLAAHVVEAAENCRL